MRAQLLGVPSNHSSEGQRHRRKTCKVMSTR